MADSLLLIVDADAPPFNYSFAERETLLAFSDAAMNQSFTTLATNRICR
jgi:hypothetical protein